MAKYDKGMEKKTKPSQINMNEQPLTAAQAGELFNVSSWAMYQRARRGQVPYHHVGKRIYFMKSELLAHAINS